MPLTAAQIATRLEKDNRTVVGSKDPADGTKDFVATDVGKTGATYGLTNAITSTAAAYSTGVTRGTGKITVAHGDGGLTKNDLRTQYFIDKNTYDSSKAGFGAKRCYTNTKGQPLDANGVPTTVALAVNAETTALTALGQAVTNYAQCHKADGLRTPVPGVYTADARATSLYAPYVGWTVTQVSSAGN
jgi:hypothetical protein